MGREGTRVAGLESGGRKGFEEVHLTAVALLGWPDWLEFETMGELRSLFFGLRLALDRAWTGLCIVLDLYFVVSGWASRFFLNGLQGMLLGTMIFVVVGLTWSVLVLSLLHSGVGLPFVGLTIGFFVMVGIRLAFDVLCPCAVFGVPSFETREVFL